MPQSVRVVFPNTFVVIPSMNVVFESILVVSQGMRVVFPNTLVVISSMVVVIQCN